MEPDHPIVIMRLVFVFLCALPAVRELYQYINNPKYVPQVHEEGHVAQFMDRKARRMGQHCWLLLATVLTELLVITKWSQGMFQEPLPVLVKWGWIVGGTALVLYPTVRVSCRFWLNGCGDADDDSLVFRLRDENCANKSGGVRPGRSDFFPRLSRISSVV